jgi:hypothetical protein
MRVHHRTGPGFEVDPLTLHRSKSRILEHQPIDHFIIILCASRVAELVFLIVLLDEIDQNAGTLKNSHFLSVQCVCDGWNPAVWIDVQEPREA